MSRQYEYVIVLDTEFVSSREGNQPFQIAMMTFSIHQNRLVKISEFNTYVQLKKGLQLNYYAKKHTGITEEVLHEYGIYPQEAALQCIHYLLSFPFDKTLLVGWDPGNDKRMLNALFNEEGDLFNIAELFDWFDIAVALGKTHEEWKGRTPSLKTAIETFELGEFAFHDAIDDCKATATLLSYLLVNGSEEEILKPTPIKKKRYQKVRE